MPSDSSSFTRVNGRMYSGAVRETKARPARRVFCCLGTAVPGSALPGFGLAPFQTSFPAITIGSTRPASSHSFQAGSAIIALI